VCVKYFDYAKRYCLKNKDLDDVAQEFTYELGVDIKDLVAKMSPLGYSFVVKEAKEIT